MAERLADRDHRLLLRIGQHLRDRRERIGLTRRAAAAQSGLSVRFLAQVEAGEGNIAVTRLARLAHALGLDPGEILMAAVGPLPGERLPIVALLGLRGAGKSTIGRQVAEQFGWSFFEHDELVESEAGMPLGEVFSLHGDEYYRRLSRATLESFLSGDPGPTILATSGGVVEDEAAFSLLLRRCHTVWLEAEPEDHWRRVVEQGDSRPMRDHPEAMEDLQNLLTRREPLYRRALHRVATSRLTADTVAQRLSAIIAVVAGTSERS